MCEVLGATLVEHHFWKLLTAFDFCIADSASVNMRDEVQQGQPREEVNVYLSDHHRQHASTTGIQGWYVVVRPYYTFSCFDSGRRL